MSYVETFGDPATDSSAPAWGIRTKAENALGAPSSTWDKALLPTRKTSYLGKMFRQYSIHSEVSSSSPEVALEGYGVKYLTDFYFEDSSIKPNKQNRSSFVNKVLSAGEDEFVDEEETSYFQSRICFSLVMGGENVAREILGAINEKRVSAEKVSAICDALGRIEDERTKPHVLSVLTSLLQNPSVSIRDAAALGIALLDDKRALPALNQALEREQRSMLRETYRDVINQIQAG